MIHCCRAPGVALRVACHGRTTYALAIPDLSFDLDPSVPRAGDAREPHHRAGSNGNRSNTWREYFIAQDVEGVLAEWVRTDPDGYMRLEPIGIHALLIEAIKEQQKQIEALEKKFSSLISRNGTETD